MGDFIPYTEFLKRKNDKRQEILNEKIKRAKVKTSKFRLVKETERNKDEIEKAAMELARTQADMEATYLLRRKWQRLMKETEHNKDE